MIKKAKLQISGIMCINCVKKITTEVGNLNGVAKVVISDDYNDSSIIYTDSLITIGEIVNCIESIDNKKFYVNKIG